MRKVNAFFKGRMLTIEIRTGVIGPQHDPYQVDEYIVVDTQANRTASYYADGLGTERIELIEGTETIRTMAWYDRTPPVQDALKANLLFKQHVGMDIDLAQSMFRELDRNYDEGDECRNQHHWMQG